MDPPGERPLLDQRGAQGLPGGSPAVLDVARQGVGVGLRQPQDEQGAEDEHEDLTHRALVRSRRIGSERMGDSTGQ